MNEVQRAERFRANQILWVTKRNLESAKEDIGDEIAEADIHHISPTLPTDDKAPKPNT